MRTWRADERRKGDSDLANARMCVDAGRALDTACFHAQQAAEKYLKALPPQFDHVLPVKIWKSLAFKSDSGL
ncbi:MAG: HEPN domain-containing protein [Kiritimatiellia bacterium]|jgi:HEPN domain-containing protein